jgi:hypothetical protein
MLSKHCLLAVTVRSSSIPYCVLYYGIIVLFHGIIVWYYCIIGIDFFIQTILDVDLLMNRSLMGGYGIVLCSATAKSCPLYACITGLVRCTGKYMAKDDLL